MYKSSIELIKHIKRESDFILKSTNSKTFNEFYSDEILKRAVIRALEIIGEASKNLSAKIKKENNNISWRNIIGMRDKVIHNYFGINLEIIWAVIKNDLPDLKVKVEKILKGIDF